MNFFLGRLKNIATEEVVQATLLSRTYSVGKQGIQFWKYGWNMPKVVVMIWFLVFHLVAGEQIRK